MEKIIDRRTVYAGRRMNVLELDVQLTSGEVKTWEVADKDGDSVAIVALTGDGGVYLVEEYFAATDERALCLPKGRIEAGENPLEAARRELREEVGHDGQLSHLTMMSVSPGYLTQRTHVFVATDLVEDAAVGDEEHHLKPIKVPLDQVLELIREGKITEARTIAALALAIGQKLYS